ncbi:MAG: deoxynucleoside kinase [Chloroflexi bacterium]|nr:deoxynucleoside kinase [Chloroflexota bacterium]
MNPVLKRVYIAIEGVIGVGKTTLARLLQSEFSAELLLEVFEENPFLSHFYTDRARYAFQTQIFFLLSRYHQQHEAVPAALERGNLIADYTFAKDALFARLNLDGDELATYQRVHEALAEKIALPDLMVYLRADTDVLMRRIAVRDRPYERGMERDYINQLGLVYDAFFGLSGRDNRADGPSSPVLTIDTNDMDFVKDGGHLNQIAGRIRAALGLGTYQASLPLMSRD